ncbi:terpenoid synthase [Armillaria luteobubalina]|uniref:Terpene synthase n=1 Tax=Armillaria luteobubalina TaxID=153913 RepID=A0AA39PXV3_9AGAR|nr:terpenoid synthase [Armillaria luteobubalina]
MVLESGVVFRIPETTTSWPWPRKINPHYEEVKAESEAWFRSFEAFTPEAQRAFDLCDYSLLASLSHTTATKEQLRTACDLMNLFFIFDEYTDNETPDVVRQYAEIVKDALRDPFKPRPDNEVVLGAVAQFWALGIKTSSITSQKRVVETFGRYMDSVVSQSEDRQQCYSRNVEDYLKIRRLTIGTDPSYAMLELGYDLPNEVFYHPTVVNLRRLACEMIMLDNVRPSAVSRVGTLNSPPDLASYNKEQASEEFPHNILVCVMNERKVDLASALLWVEDFHHSISAKFLRLWEEIPTWGPGIDDIASLYLEGIANSVRSNDCWNFESVRYFGANGKAIQQHRMVTLMPKRLTMDQPLLIHAQQ